MLYEVPCLLTWLTRHRADSDYYPRLYSMILDQLEVVAESKKDMERFFRVQSRDTNEIVDLEKAKEFVVSFWKRFLIDGADRKFRVVPIGL
jgi:hypothetical protein